MAQSTFKMDIKINDLQVRRSLRRLRRSVIPKATAEVLNKIAHEILEAEQKHIAGSFDFSGAGTKKFLSNAYFFTPARAGRNIVVLRPKPKGLQILHDHQFGTTFTARREDHLALGDELAIPNKDMKLRGKRGKVSRSKRPNIVVKGEGRIKGYKKGKAIYRRIGRGKSKKEVLLFTLGKVARIKPRLDIFRVAKRAAKAKTVAKAKQVMRKHLRGRI